MTKLVVPSMPEFKIINPVVAVVPLGEFNETRAWGEQCAAIAQREAALADELAEALEGLRISFLSRLGDRENEEWDTNFCNAMKALSNHKEAR